MNRELLNSVYTPPTALDIEGAANRILQHCGSDRQVSKTCRSEPQCCKMRFAAPSMSKAVGGVYTELSNSIQMYGYLFIARLPPHITLRTQKPMEKARIEAELHVAVHFTNLPVGTAVL
jgi:hypothetical protein